MTLRVCKGMREYISINHCYYYFFMGFYSGNLEGISRDSLGFPGFSHQFRSLFFSVCNDSQGKIPGDPYLHTGVSHTFRRESLNCGS